MYLLQHSEKFCTIYLSKASSPLCRNSFQTVLCHFEPGAQYSSKYQNALNKDKSRKGVICTTEILVSLHTTTNV